uniref:Hydroxypyruvate isomerase n=1 Tax=Callorhinchus milii TaxID=7868 RepID=A0A4W3GWG1_CALMI
MGFLFCERYISIKVYHDLSLSHKSFFYIRLLRASYLTQFSSKMQPFLYENMSFLIRRLLAFSFLGILARGELGLGAVVGQQDEFRSGLDLAVKYAKALDCKRIHLMAGRVPAGQDKASVTKKMECTFIENLKYAADILSKEGILGLVEPINNRITDPNYFLNTPHQAVQILQKVDRPNMKLQLDVFHWQIMDGNLTQNINTYFPLIGHVQIAQVPGRNEPDSPGEVNYSYIFNLLEELGYQGYIGCEYAPKGNTVDGLGWLKTYWNSRGQP